MTAFEDAAAGVLLARIRRSGVAAGVVVPLRVKVGMGMACGRRAILRLGHLRHGERRALHRQGER